MKKRKVKTERQKLVAKLDALAKEVTILRDGMICQKCYKPIAGANAHCSHVLPKSMGLHVRWVPENLKMLCYHDHLNWWHKNPVESGAWFKNKYPRRGQILKAIRLGGKQTYRMDDLLEIQDELLKLRDTLKIKDDPEFP